MSVMAADPPYVYDGHGNYGGVPPTPEEYAEAFENAPACHHDHGGIARQASEFLAALEGDRDEGE